MTTGSHPAPEEAAAGVAARLCRSIARPQVGDPLAALSGLPATVGTLLTTVLSGSIAVPISAATAVPVSVFDRSG